MVEGLKLKPFEEKDLDQVVHINWTCLPENYSNSFFLELYHHSPKTFVVATINDKIVGYIMCRMETGFSEVKRLGITKKGHVVSLAVLPEYRRMEIGCALVAKVLEGMKEYHASECYLEVRISNNAAINLYKKFGFKPVRTINNYYKDGEGAYVMAKGFS